MFKSLLSNFILGKKAVLFAITNACNCKCEMCSIWKQKNKNFVKFREAKNALLNLYRNNFGFLQLTGGEPILNPDFHQILEHAKKLNFTVFLVTNGTLINESVAKKLSQNKLDNVGISFHHYDNSIFEKISNHKNILNKVLNAIDYLKKENIPVEALFTISQHNKDCIEETVKFINNLDIGVSFCIPMVVKNTSYSLGGSCVEFSNGELKETILEIIRLKKDGYNIVNNMAFLKDVINFIDGRSKFYCVGGSEIFYLDWKLDLYPCMFKGKAIKIDQVDFNFKKEICDKCLFQCFREPSLFLISRPLTLKLILRELPMYLRFM